MTRILPVFSSVFPGPQMPWHTNSSLQLQDMYDQVYFHLIGMSHHRTTILQVLGQCLFSDVMDPDLKIIGSPASATSPKRIETRLGLERGTISRILAPIHVLLDLGTGDRNIKFRDPSFRSFLLEQSRSQELFLDLDDARLTLKFAAPIRKAFGARGT